MNMGILFNKLLLRLNLISETEYADVLIDNIEDDDDINIIESLMIIMFLLTSFATYVAICNYL